MKKKIYLVLFLCLAAVSCDSFFDINLQDQPTLEDTMKRSSSVKRYLAHLYSYIPRDENVRNYEGGTVLRADESLVAKSQYETFWYKVRRGEYGSDNAVDESSANPWKRFYTGINECSSFLANLYLDEEDSPQIVKQMEGEARFLRAYYYFVLLRQWGPVIIWGEEPASQSLIWGDDAKNLDRNTLDENFKFIISELDKAIELLCFEVDDKDLGLSIDSNKGRATKGAAMALKTRVLLYRASPLYNGQNGSGIYSGFQNSRGEKLFPEYDASKWNDVAKAAEDLLALGRYTLATSSAGGTPIEKAAANYQCTWFQNWNINKEIIWGWWYRAWGDESLGQGCDVAYAAPAGGKIALEGYSLTSPSLKLVDAYPMWETGRYPVLGYEKTDDLLDLSRPQIDPQSGYKSNGWTDNYQQPVDVDPSWATPFKAHNSTVGRDARYYANFVPNGFWWPSSTTKGGGPTKFTCFNSSTATSPYSETGACNRVGYVWRRLYKAGNPLKDHDSDYKSMRYVYPAFRLAEVYLTYAEALNEMTERNASKAIEYIDKVRERSGLPGLRTSYPDIDFDNAEGTSTIGEVTRTGREWLRWIILQERMCEFAMEGQRHYDMMRWMKAMEEYNMDNWTLHVAADNYEDSYERVNTDYIGGRSVFTERDYLFPIGSLQISQMTSFTQNPGW